MEYYTAIKREREKGLRSIYWKAQPGKASSAAREDEGRGKGARAGFPG